jgi:hypothetical protein
VRQVNIPVGSKCPPYEYRYGSVLVLVGWAILPTVRQVNIPVGSKCPPYENR